MFGWCHAGQDGPVCDSAAVPVLAGFKPSRWLQHRLAAVKAWLGFPAQHSPDTLRDGHRARAQSCSEVAVLPLQAALFCCKLPILLSPVPDLAPCTEPWGVSPSLVELPPATSWAPVSLCAFGPFFAKILKASLAPKLYITMFYLLSLCVLK